MTMARRVKIGLLDSGVPRGADRRALTASGFKLDAAQEVAATAATSDALGHASAVAGVVHAACPDACLIIAQIFFDRLVTTAAQAAAGLDWLVEQEAAIVNMSFGLAADRAVLREACARAVTRGVVLVASAPARGDPVFPAAYPQVIRVTGDARCAAGELSALDGPRADFGAPVRAADGGAGASIGAAHVTAEIARYLAAGGDPQLGAVRSHLRGQCRYFGPERRTAESAAAPRPSPIPHVKDE
jgi:hypothetical protein